MSRDPCHYCGMRGIVRYRLDTWSNEIVADVRDHDCPKWAPNPPLSREPTDTSFIGAARNDPEAFGRWQTAVRKP